MAAAAAPAPLSPAPAAGPTVIGYHHPCPDGATAALAATLGLLSRRGVGLDPTLPLATQLGAGCLFLPLAVYESPAARIDKLHSLLRGVGGRCAVMYLLDFSGGVDFLRAAAAASDEVVLLDHHKTAQEDIAAATAAGTVPPNLKVRLPSQRL